jgi:trehalose/maltose hydrolase-like predicted phosphorylase
VTAGVGWAHWQYWLATQDKAWLRTRGWPVLSGVADYFASRATKNAQTGKWDIRSVFGPDELKGRVDNNTYTNALARYCLLAAGEAARIVRRPANSKWASVAANIALPYDKANDRYLAREMTTARRPSRRTANWCCIRPPCRCVQQTAANTFDFHAARPIRNGPAMTASIHALLAARLGRADEAERYFRESYRPFVRGPFLLFSEKRSLDRCVFATGAGGVLQSVLYGFGGLDWAQFDKIGGANDPYPVALPPSWKKLTITGIQRAGKRYTLTVTPQGRTLTRTK